MSRKNCFHLITISCLLLLLAADLNAARRSIRVDFGAWGPARNILIDPDLCPMYYTGSALDFFYFRADSLVFQNDVLAPDPYTVRRYCQDAGIYEEGMTTDEYLNSEIFPPDEAGLAAKIGSNLDGGVTAVRYTFLDGSEFQEDTEGYQWAFYRFPGEIMIVALYGTLPIEAGAFSPHIYFETPEATDYVWTAASEGFEGQYFCFDEVGVPEFIGFWDGKYAGTNPEDGCRLDYVSSRDTLVALYESTGGESWNHNENWLVGDPCENDWYGVGCGKEGEYCDAIEDEEGPWEPGDLCYGPLTEIMGIDLGGNNLVGTIPSALGRNNLNDLWELYLSGNDLAGNIPVELGNFTNLEYLYLDRNQLSGNVPAELGNLTNLYGFGLYANQLTGIIPAELCNLTFVGSIDTDYNRLQNPADPLCALQDVGVTQTVPPLGLVVTTAEAPVIELSWDAIEYTGDTGRYRAWYSTSPDGPFLDGGATASKSETSLTIEGVEPHQIYYIVIRTETDAHPGNPNDLVSEDSEMLRVLFEKVFFNGFEKSTP